MNKLNRGPLGDATYLISKLHVYAFQFKRGGFFLFSFFVPLFQIVTPGSGPV